MIYQSFESKIEVIQYVEQCGSSRKQLGCVAEVHSLISDIVEKTFLTSVANHLGQTQLKQEDEDKVKRMLVIKQDWTDAQMGFHVF